MERELKWIKKEEDVYESPDGYIVIRSSNEVWIMEDSIDELEESYMSLQEALNAGGKQRLISDMGQFSTFIRPMKEMGELVFNHVFS